MGQTVIIILYLFVAQNIFLTKFVCIFVHLSVPICLYVCLFICLCIVGKSVCLFVYLHMSVSFCLPVLLSIYFSVSILSYVFLSVLSACLSIFGLPLITNNETLKKM